MSRKKNKRNTGTVPRHPHSQKGDPEANWPSDRTLPVAQTSPTASPPSATTRTAISIWVTFHLFAILVSFLAVVEPSGIHTTLIELLRPYLHVTHFGADDRPVYLAHGDASEQPHRVQVTRAKLSEIESTNDVNWVDVGPAASAGFAVSDRVHRWAATAALLAETEQASLVAELLLPLAVQNPDAEAIRIVRYPTDLNDILASEESPYVARIIREGDSATLVQLKPQRLSASVANESANHPLEDEAVE